MHRLTRSRLEDTVSGAVHQTRYQIATESAASGRLDEILQMERDGQEFYYHAGDQGNVLAITDAVGDVEPQAWPAKWKGPGREDSDAAGTGLLPDDWEMMVLGDHGSPIG